MKIEYFLLTSFLFLRKGEPQTKHTNFFLVNMGLLLLSVKHVQNLQISVDHLKTRKLKFPKFQNTMLYPDARNQRLIVKNNKLLRLAMAATMYQPMLDIKRD